MSPSHSNRRFSVLLICDSYPPVLGGSEIEAQRVSAALIQRGHQVEVLCAGGPPMPPVRRWVDPAGVPVRILTRRSRGRLRDVIFACEVAWAIWRGRHRFDAIYFLMQGLHLAAGLPVARFIHKPIVMKFGGSGVIPYMRRSRAGRLELNWMRGWAARLLVLNEGMVEEALADGFDRSLLTWMPNPVDTSEFRPPVGGEAAAWRSQHDIPQDACVVVYVGRLSQEKGLVDLLKGFAYAAQRNPRAVLVLVGDGAQRPELESLARRLELPASQVRFVGRVDVRQVPLWLRASDIFALTSPNEGLSCALLEAMATGLCSVVSAIPANLQLIEDRVHGFTVPVDNEVATGDAFLRLFADERVRQRMGREARQRVIETYSTDRVVDRYETLFEQIVGHGQCKTHR